MLNRRGFVLSAWQLATATMVALGPAVVPTLADIGPDVAICDIQSLRRWGALDNITGYSIGTLSVNVGDDNLSWIEATPFHPVISQNLFRLKDGRFEHIGQSWVKHTFCAIQNDSPCSAGCITLPSCGDYLTPGCQDPYSANRNGTQNLMGPKWQINAATGQFPWPPLQGDQGFVGDVTYKRLQVHNEDLDPALNAGARYFVEGMYITPDEQGTENRFNNATFREVLVGPAPNYDLSFLEDAVFQEVAITVWPELDREVQLTSMTIPNDGMVMLGARAADSDGDGIWQYEYGIYNMNSDRSIASFSLPLPENVTVSNVGFHDVDYHSGDGPNAINLDGADWPATVAKGALTWSVIEPHATNPNGNALRWGTLYSFRFDADSPPTTATATLGLFKPGTPDSVTLADLPAPRLLPYCTGDIEPDGLVDALDLALVLGSWGTANPIPDVNHDGVVNTSDLALVLGSWGQCDPPAVCCNARRRARCEILTAAECGSAGGIYLAGSSDCADCLTALCGDPAAGDCCSANGTPACDDAACCMAVCDTSPECCDSEWGAGCAAAAQTVCRQRCADPPPNDACADSLAILAGDTAYTTLGATTDGSAHASCQFDGQTYNDIWFDYIADCTGALTIATCGQADYDTDLVLYQGCDCGTMVLANCADDSPGCAGDTSRVATSAVQGTCYKVRVGGFGAASAGNGTLSIICE